MFALYKEVGSIKTALDTCVFETENCILKNDGAFLTLIPFFFAFRGDMIGISLLSYIPP